MAFIDFNSPKKTRGFVDFSQPQEPVQPTQDELGDTNRGFKTSIGQTMPLLQGTIGAIGATAEKLFGEGGYSTDVKNWGLTGYQVGMKKLEPLHRENDDVTVAWEKAKSGDIGAMVDWMQYGLGYGAGQIAETAAVAVIGGLAGSAVAPGPGTAAGVAAGVGGKSLVKTAAANLVEKALAKEVALITEKNIAEGMAREAAISLANSTAAKSLGSKLGQDIALGGFNLSQSVGGIYGEAEEQAKKEGRELTGGDLARVWGAAVLSAGAETYADKLGLDALTGKSRIAGATRTGRAATGAFGGVMVEGGTEGVQTVLERFGAGKNLSNDEAISEYINSVALGSLMGGSAGGVRGAMTGNQKKDDLPIIPPKNIMDQTDIDSVINAAENSIDQLPAVQREATPIDDPMRLEIINQLPEALRDAATRAYNIIIDDEAPKGIKKQNQKLLDDILAQAASEMQPTNTAPIDDLTIEQPKPLEPFEQIKQLQSKVSDLEANNPFEQDHMDSLNELQSAVTNYTASKLESGEMPVFTSGELTIIVTPSAKQEGLFQVTRYSKNGAIGDSEYTSIEKAVELEGLQYNTPLSGKEAVAAITQANEAEGNFQSRLAEQKLKESNRVLADIESTDSRVSFEQEKSRVNQRNAIIDSILASDAAVDMRPAQIADMVKSSMAEQGYANPVLSDSEFSRIKRFNDIAKAEPVAETIDETNLEGQAPSSNLSDLVPERRIDASKSNVIATKLPADLISVAQESETNKDFWKALTARKIPLGPERNALMAAYKELKAQPINPTVTPATPVAQTTEIAKTVTPQSKQFSDSLKGIIESEVSSMAQVIETKKLPETSPAFGNYVAKQTHVEAAAVVAQSVVESGDLSLFEAKAPESNRTFASLYPSTYAKLQEHVESAQPTTAIPNSASNIAPTEIPNTVTSVTPTEIPNSTSSISTTAIPKTEIASSTTSIAPTAIPTSATSITPTEIPTSAATVTATAIPETTLKPDGNLSIKGNTKELQTQLKEAGIPSLPSKDGVTVGAKNVEKAQEFIASIVPVETKLPEVKTENNLSKTENNLVSVDSATIGPASKDYQSAIVAPAVDAIDSGKATKVDLKDGSAVDLVNMTDKDGARTIVAVSDGKVVGSLGYATVEGFSPDAYVDKDFQRKGIASAMYDLAEKSGGVIPPVDATNAVRTEDGAAFRNARAGVLPSAESGVKLSNPAQQTTAQKGLTGSYKKGKTGAETARNKLAYENPFLSFLATHGVSIQDRSDVGGDKKRGKLIPGHGPLFRKNGVRLDELAQLALEKGFITQAQMDSENDNGGVNALSEMINRAVRNEVVTTVKDVAENRNVDEELMQEASSIGIDISGKTSDEVYDLVKEHHDEKAYQEAVDLLNELSDEYKSASQEYNLQELVFGIEEFENAKENSTRGEGEANQAPREIDSRRAGETESSSRSTTETATEQAQTSDGSSGDQGFRLTGETTQEANARIAQEESNSKAKEAESAKQDDADRKAQIKKEIDSRQESSAENFQLGQSAEDSLSGQRDIFSSDQAKEQIHASDLTPGEKLANIAAVNRGDVSADDVAKALDTESKPNKIGDFGKKIGGAKKDVWSGFKDKMDTAKALDIASEPLSKSWPEPDYQALLDNGADSWAVGFMHAARDAVPRKPTKSYKLKSWADGVKTLRNFAANIADGTISTEKVKAEMQILAGKYSPFHWDELLTRIELYQAVGHSKSLADIRLSSGEYNMLNGVLYNPAKVIWTVEKKAATTAFSNFPQQLAQGETKQDAIDDFKERFSKLETVKPASKEISFDVYSTQGQTGFKVGKKVGRNFIELAGPFATVKEAREYKLNNQDALIEKLEKTKEIPRERRDTNNPRVGEDMRDGEDVTPEMFSDAFGFRGVEFGNYVEQGKRQSDLNEAYDALMDMAALLGVPPKSISLNGTLGLAFGARGTGGKLAAAAHYERDKIVINLTKKSGAGSLGHEWWHALDNYFSRAAKKPGDYMTDRTDVLLASREAKYLYRDEGVRKEMIDAFGSVMRSIRLTAIKARSSKLDAKRTKEYWTTDVEMSARAFESYLISKLQDNNASNDYLANIIDPDTWVAAEKLGFELDESYPYPTAGEIPAIRAGFDKFFSVIESKETEKGIALFSRDVVQRSKFGFDVDELQPIVDQISSTWKNAPKINIVQTVDDLPFDSPNDVRGAYYKNQVYLVAANLRNTEQAQAVLFHEALGHAGLSEFFGADLTRALRSIGLRNRSLAQAANVWRKQNLDIKGKMSDDKYYLKSIEEALADYAGTGRVINGIEKLIAAIQKGLRAIGLNSVADWIENATDAEVLSMLASARKKIVQGDDVSVFGGQQAQAFSRDGENNKPDALFSRIAGNISPQVNLVNPHSWNAPEQTNFDDLLYKYQDKQIDTKRVVDSISKNIADDLNVYEKEELFHNRSASRVKEFINQEQRPLLDSMKELGIDMATLEEYLHARTAEETNILVAWRNRETGILKDGGSGMKTADARKYLASLVPAQRKNLEAIAAKVDAIVESTRQMYVDYGLESKSTVDGWRDMFDHYVPLMREQDGETHGMGVGQGFSVKGKEVKGRTGSTRKVVDIFANIAMQREKVIVRGEKNKVATALLELAKSNPNPDFWSVDKPETKRVYNPDTDSVVEQSDPLFKSRENVIVAKVKDSKGNIEEKAVIFVESNPRSLRMSQALKNLDTQQMNGFMGGMATVTRYFSAINTQYNPIFGVVNLVRDFQGALINLSSTALSGHKAEVAKHTLSALKAIYLDERAGKKGGKNNSEMAKLWREFELEGGPTGYRDMFANSADRAKAIQKELDPTKWMDSPLGKVFTANGMLKVPMAQAYKQASGMFGVLSDYNTAMENSVRLAAYKVAKDQGMSNQKAASLAKNLTVNFNRKGQVAQQVGALYAFFNASMQGSARLSQTLFTIDKGDIKTARLSSTGKKIVYGGVLLGVVQALMLSAAGLEEDEPPEFVRERSLIIPTGWTGLTDEKAYINIPMPLGLHVLPNLGRIPTEFALNGFKKPTEKVIGLMGLVAGAFNPTGGGVSLAQAISFTATDPIIALAENKDWTGKPIAKESYNKALPGHALAKDTSSYVSKILSQGFNYLTGGTEYTRGTLSPTPDQIDYLIGQAFGGVGREALKTQQSISATMTGEDLPIYKVPLVGRFYGNAESQSSQANRFYANVDLLNEHETEIKGMKEDRKGLELARYMRENPEARMFEAVNKVEREIQQLRKVKRDLLKADAEPARIKMIENQIKMKMTRFNESFASVRKSLE